MALGTLTALPAERSQQRPVVALVADPAPAVRGALTEVLAAAPGFECGGTAGTADELWSRLRLSPVDVVLLDPELDGSSSLTAEIRRRFPHTHVVVHASAGDRRTVLDHIGAGALGFVIKGAPAREVLTAVGRAAAGKTTVSPEVAADVIAMVAERLSEEHREADRRRAEEQRLRRALAGIEYRVVFQPIVELDTGRTVGVEALSRFDSVPGRGPQNWFEDADRNGLRIDLDLLAVRTALSQIGSMAAARFLTVNLSPTTILSRAFASALPDSCEHLVIEVTENAAIRDYDVFCAALTEFRSRGGRIAIDDFGAGYASLRHVLRLDPSFIKLDMDLTHRLSLDSRARALALGLSTFADELGAEIIAEGVENDAERRALHDMGIRLGQGFYLAGPLDADSVLS